MESFRQELWFDHPKHMGFINITHEVERCLQSGVRERLCLVNAMHITALVFINDDESGLLKISAAGWNSWLPMMLTVMPITAPAKTMAMPI